MKFVPDTTRVICYEAEPVTSVRLEMESSNKSVTTLKSNSKLPPYWDLIDKGANANVWESDDPFHLSYSFFIPAKCCIKQSCTASLYRIIIDKRVMRYPPSVAATTSRHHFWRHTTLGEVNRGCAFVRHQQLGRVSTCGWNTSHVTLCVTEFGRLITCLIVLFYFWLK